MSIFGASLVALGVVVLFPTVSILERLIAAILIQAGLVLLSWPRRRT
jgi:hypothetical protein